MYSLSSTCGHHVLLPLALPQVGEKLCQLIPLPSDQKHPVSHLVQQAGKMT